MVRPIGLLTIPTLPPNPPSPPTPKNDKNNELSSLKKFFFFFVQQVYLNGWQTETEIKVKLLRAHITQLQINQTGGEGGGVPASSCDTSSCFLSRAIDASRNRNSKSDENNFQCSLERFKLNKQGRKMAEKHRKCANSSVCRHQVLFY